MCDTPEISIIVPVYNVEKYLNKCVDSILNQTFTDFELILVDDESPDNCGNICEEYAKQDSRVKVIHKKNGGLSSARNAGIDIARGKFLGFVDSDDYIAPDMYETLYNNILKDDADISVCGIYDCYENKVSVSYNSLENFTVDKLQAFKLLLEGKKIAGSICNKLIKRDIIKDIRFPVGRLYEDAFFTNSLIQVVNTVTVTTAPKYYYMHRQNSITTVKFNCKLMDIIDAYTECLNIVKDKFPAITKQAYFRYFWAHFIILDKMLLTQNYLSIPEYKKVVHVLKTNTLKIFSNNCFENSRRLAALALGLNVKLYKVLLEANNKKYSINR